MDRPNPLRLNLPKTRRFTGRRALTPMKSRHKTIPKTRCHRVEKKPHVSIRKHSVPHVEGRREETDPKKHCEDSQREGDQDCCDHERREDKEEHTQAETLRGTENSEKSVHPGPVQTVSVMHQEGADDQTYANAEIEAEELP